MLTDVVWLTLIVSMANLGLIFWISSKILKLEKSQGGEAQANLELINQSLNRLSQLIETQERPSQPVRVTESDSNQAEGNSDGTKERRAISLLRHGENPRIISRKLGISRSEMDLLMASERLGSGHKSEVGTA
jgi:hypothetical protein